MVAGCACIQVVDLRANHLSDSCRPVSSPVAVLLVVEPYFVALLFLLGTAAADAAGAAETTSEKESLELVTNTSRRARLSRKRCWSESAALLHRWATRATPVILSRGSGDVQFQDARRKQTGCRQAVAGPGGSGGENGQ